VYDVVAHTGKDNTSPYQRFREDVQKSGDKKVLGKVDATIIKLREVGLDLLATNMMDTIEDRIYELRTGKYRVFCFFDVPCNRFVLLNGFRKDTRKTPEPEKAKARDSVDEYLSIRRC
jgi:phage-related protein